MVDSTALVSDGTFSTLSSYDNKIHICIHNYLVVPMTRCAYKVVLDVKNVGR